MAYKYASARKFNVCPSPEDKRDIKYTFKNVTLPTEVDLREWDSPVEDQGSLGSCVSHALTSCSELMTQRIAPEQFVELSRLFSYYHTRFIEGSITKDSGVACLRNALKASNKFGICKEQLWPYITEKFKQQPTPDCYVDAANRKTTVYQSLDTRMEAIEALSELKPVMVGMTVYKSFSNITGDNPIISMPAKSEYEAGGHAVALVGYSLLSEQFIVKNSFGTSWGEAGYCLMPFEYFDRYVFEKWIFDVSTSVEPTTLTEVSVTVEDKMLSTDYQPIITGEVA